MRDNNRVIIFRFLARNFPMTATNIVTPFFLSDRVQPFPPQTELMPKQAAEFLCVSEPFLLELLDSGEIVSRNLDGQRMVVWDSLLKYDLEMSQRQNAALDELVQLSEEMGLYDDESCL
jgi:hypothetical protein